MKDSAPIILALLAAGSLIFFKYSRDQVAQEPLAPPPSQTQSPITASSDEDPRLNRSIAPDEPYQRLIRDGVSFPFLKYRILPIAKFRAKGLILSLKDYRTGPDEHRISLSPTDIALGWGPMATASILKNFRYYQANRFFYYANYVSFSQEALDLDVDAHVANIHIIPSNASVAALLRRLQPLDMVELEGKLVRVFFKGQAIWESSLSRTDSGDGACELLYLERIEWYQQPLKGLDVPLPIEEPQS